MRAKQIAWFVILLGSAAAIGFTGSLGVDK